MTLCAPALGWATFCLLNRGKPRRGRIIATFLLRLLLIVLYKIIVTYMIVLFYKGLQVSSSWGFWFCAVFTASLCWRLLTSSLKIQALVSTYTWFPTIVRAANYYALGVVYYDFRVWLRPKIRRAKTTLSKNSDQKLRFRDEMVNMPKRPAPLVLSCRENQRDF